MIGRKCRHIFILYRIGVFLSIFFYYTKPDVHFVGRLGYCATKKLNLAILVDLEAAIFVHPTTGPSLTVMTATLGYVHFAHTRISDKN